MAIYPCNIDAHRYVGRQQSAYATVVSSNQPETRKARLCPTHFELLLAEAQRSLTAIDVSMQSSLVCEKCDEPTTTHVFLTAYPEQEEPVYFAGDFCRAHSHATLERLGWPQWTSRTP